MRALPWPRYGVVIVLLAAVITPRISAAQIHPGGDCGVSKYYSCYARRSYVYQDEYLDCLLACHPGIGDWHSYGSCMAVCTFMWSVKNPFPECTCEPGASCIDGTCVCDPSGIPGQVHDEACIWSCPVGQVVCPSGNCARPAECGQCPTGTEACGRNCVSCPAAQEVDPQTCSCRCPGISCPPGKHQDPSSCGCVCDAGTSASCPPGYHRDPNTCGCVCTTTCGGQCPDTTSDPANCGGCGNSCGTSRCVGGRCCNGSTSAELAAHPPTAVCHGDPPSIACPQGSGCGVCWDWQQCCPSDGTFTGCSDPRFPCCSE
jgi:hypothetical protein